MDIKQLRYFQSVARLSSFTQAATELGIAQPAVSVAIKKLETELGLKLLNRIDRQVSLTAEGKCLLTHADRLLSNYHDALLEMGELRGLEKGEVRIGIPSMMGSYFFPPLLMAFKNRYPKLKISVFEGGTRELLQQLNQGRLDIGIVVGDDITPDLEARPLLKEEMVICVPDEHEFSTRTNVSVEEFLQQDLVLFRSGYFHREHIDSLSKLVGTEPKIAFETNLLPLIKAIVSQGFAITTMLRFAIEGDSNLSAVSFSDPMFLELNLAWKKGRYLSNADQSFVHFLLENTGTQKNRTR